MTVKSGIFLPEAKSERGGRTPASGITVLLSKANPTGLFGSQRVDVSQRQGVSRHH